MQRGYVKLWRKVSDTGLLPHPHALQVFVWCLLNCAWKPTRYATRYGVIELNRGEAIMGRKKLSRELEISEQKIRTALNLLSTMKIITIKTTNRFSIIRLENWDKYQTEQAQATTQTTSSQPAANQQLTTVKEDKHLRKEQESLPSAPPAPEIQAEHKKGYGYLRAAFAKLPSPPIITESLGIEVGRVNRKAQGVGLKDFQRVVDAYCKEEYPGKSIANFLMGFDRLANKLLGAEREVRARRQRELKTLFTELREQPNG